LSTDVSQGNVMICVRCDTVTNHQLIANLVLSLTVKKFWTSVNIWRSYQQE